MSDTALEIENISNRGDEPPSTVPPLSMRPTAEMAAGTRQQQQQQQTSPPAADNPISTNLGNRAPSRVGLRTTSERSEGIHMHTEAARPRSRPLPITEPDDGGTRRTDPPSVTHSAGYRPGTQQPQAPVRNEIQRISFASQTSRARGVLQREPDSELIVESPPLYTNLFPAGNSSIAHSTTNCELHCHNSCLPCEPGNSLSLSSAIPRRPWAQHGHHCHDPTDWCLHGSHHCQHTLPGEISPPSDHVARHLSQHHSTVIPMHNCGSERQQGQNDYLKLSFICVAVCTLHLNLSALLCVLPALGCSIMAHKLNAEGRYRAASKYSRAALICNVIAFCQYVLVVLAVAAVVAFVVNRDQDNSMTRTPYIIVGRGS